MEVQTAQLPRFYAGREVLITGATGFMGKVLVERLLSTCPEVGRLHLLMRDKRGQPPHKRLAHLKQSQVFDNIRASCPERLDKMSAVGGDVSQPLLGLNAGAVDQLREVSLVFHGAASVKFSEPLDAAVAHNVLSALYVLELCDKLPKLEALVHMSTAFSNTELRHIEERVYAAPVRLPQLLALLDALPPHVLHQVTTMYIQPKPNTYVFTKALAEVVVSQHMHADRHYSAAIFRPTIVVSSHRAPFPGWVEGLSGACGVVVGTGQGLLRVFNADMDARADIVPVDVAIDNMIAVAWETATDRPSAPRVYYCGSQEHPLPWRQFCAAVLREVVDHPLDNVLYYPFSYGVRNRHLYKLLEVVLQTAPLYAAEYIVKLCRIKQPISLITAAHRLRAMNQVLSFFACQQWTFSADNLRRLRERLHHTDGHIYHLDIKDVDWEEHTANFVRGTRRYMLRQKDEHLPRARRHVARLRALHRVVLVLLCALCYTLGALLVTTWLQRADS